MGTPVRLAVVLLWSALSSAPPMAQTMYKSVGPDGRIVYSDRPPVEGRLEKTINFEHLPSSPLPGATSSYLEQLRKTVTAPSANTVSKGVVLYSASWCGFCKKAKAYLAGNGISYQEFDVDTKDGMAAFAQAGGGKGVPLLVADGQRIQGFTPAAYDAFFANRH